MTEPLYAHVEHPLPAPADTWQHAEPEPEPEPETDRAWRSILDDLLADRPVDQIAHPHNGFHADQAAGSSLTAVRR